MDNASILLAAPVGAEYEKVTGLDRATLEGQRMAEAVAAEKTASDYSHIVWAYGVIWALFCVYGIILWRRSQRLAADVEAVTRQLDRLG